MKKFLLLFSLISIILIISISYAKNNVIELQKNDIVETYNYLKDNIPEMDKEFDTKSSYKNKISSLSFTDLYIFETEKLKSNYDPKKETLNITLKLDDVHKCILIKETLMSDKYKATNAFGAEINVVKLDHLGYYISPVNRLRKTDWKYEITPDIAKILKENIRALIFCQLKSQTIKGIPLYINKISYRDLSPTFHSPLESNKILNIIYANISEIWIYDKINNNIIFKQKY